jgi:alanine-glyoxylate transaminase/serine-glyoxylate transaminase/serine-pyruvate transaminase
VPGLSPLSFGPSAVAKLQARRSPVQSWFLDQSLVMGYWSGGAKRSYHHTAPVNALYALHEALRILAAEGLEQSWLRHAAMHELLRAGLEPLDVRFVVDAAHRLPQLNSVHIPAGVDDAAVRTRLLEEFNLEIGAGLGELAGKAWRIGLMGYGARRENIALCLKALETVLR